MSFEFRTGGEWKVLPGMAFGQRSPVLLGKLLVTLPDGLSLAALDQAMAPYAGEAAPDDGTDDDGPAALVRKALHWVGAVQRHHKVPVFGSGTILARLDADGSTLFHVAVPYASREAAAEALTWVAQSIKNFVEFGSVSGAVPDEELQLSEKLQASFQEFSQKGVNSYHFLKAGHDLKVPVRPVSPGVYCFGTGRHGRLLDSSLTDRTSAIGTKLSKNKMLTAHILKQAGLPAPRHGIAGTPEDARQLARQLGFPVVVKPVDQDQGKGVAANLANEAAVDAAFAEASRYSSNILVEKHFDGQDYRLTVLNGRVVKTAVRVPGGVTGDGVRSVRQLVARAQDDPNIRRRSRERGRDLMSLDQEALGLLAEAGLTPDSVPAADRYVCLRARANISAGGTSMLVPEPLVHPDNRRLAERAAAALRLDVAGIDLIIQDISRSWLEVGALICEVNAQPQIGATTSPHIYRDILQELLGTQCRVPVVLVVGDAQTVDEHRQTLCRDAGRTMGWSSRQGVWEQGVRVSAPQADGFVAGQILMASPSIDAAVIVMSPDEILRYGLPLDRCGSVVLASSPAPDRRPAALQRVWSMVLPHVADTVAAPVPLEPLMPGPAEVRSQGLRVFHGRDVADCLGKVIQGNEQRV